MWMHDTDFHASKITIKDNLWFPKINQTCLCVKVELFGTKLQGDDTNYPN